MKALLISPHLDDAVLSCGAWLAAHPGSRVLTVFAGAPPDAARMVTDWDRHCGFTDAAQAMTARRAEDAAALGRLRAQPWWLDFLDSQYGATPDLDTLADALLGCLREAEPACVLLPLGLFHSDHACCHQAVLHAARRLARPPQLLAYEDVVYRGRPGLLQQRLVALAAAGWQATPLPCEPADAAAKHEALACYASQLRGLGERALADARQPERLWRLETPEG